MIRRFIVLQFFTCEDKSFSSFVKRFDHIEIFLWSISEYSKFEFCLAYGIAHSTKYPIFQNPADKSWRKIYFDKISFFLHTARMPLIIIGGYEYASKPQMVNVGILKCTYLLHYRKDRILDPLIVFFIFPIQMVPRIFYDSKKIMNALIEFWTKCIFLIQGQKFMYEGIKCLWKIRSENFYFGKIHFEINTPRPC